MPEAIPRGRRGGTAAGALPLGRHGADVAGVPGRFPKVDDEALLTICHQAVDAVPKALATVADWAPAGERPGQYAIDLVADRAVLEVLDPTGIGVLSEESGLHRPAADLVAVVDPVDGSTNAARGIPWYATSICIVDGAGPRVAVVANLAGGVRYQAVRGSGATRDGVPIEPSPCRRLGEAIVGVTGYPPAHLGWAQLRALGAAALDLCAVADGTLDAFMVAGAATLAPWDYLGALLVCLEVGAHVGELHDLALVELDHDARRAVVAAGTGELLDHLRESTGAEGAGV